MDNYYNMVEELAGLIDGGMCFDVALNEVKKEHDLDDEETERLTDKYLRGCHGGETEDDFSVAKEKEFSDVDDFLDEDIDALLHLS